MQFINTVSYVKYISTRWLIVHAGMFTAWLFNTLFSLALVAGSSHLVVHNAPAAAGSGIPEVRPHCHLTAAYCLAVCRCSHACILNIRYWRAAGVASPPPDCRHSQLLNM